MSEISRTNETIHCGCTDPTQATAGLVIVHVSMQDTKGHYWGQQFCQLEKDISVRPTEMSRPVKVDHLQSWSQIFRSDQTEVVSSV